MASISTTITPIMAPESSSSLPIVIQFNSKAVVVDIKCSPSQK